MVTIKFKQHLENVHNINLESYIVKAYYNDEYPVCNCGCGNKLNFNPKNCLYTDGHGFGKYFNCGHVSKNFTGVNKSYKSKYNNLQWLYDHYDKIYGIENIKNALNDFLHDDDLTLADLSVKYNIDKRTLKKIWSKLNLISEDEYNNRIKHNQFKVSVKHRRIIFENKEEVCQLLYNIAKQFPGKFTIYSLINYYNDNNLVQIETDRTIILKALEEQYGEEIYTYLNYGYHSKEEIEFINILKFYFGKSAVKTGKHLKNFNYIYDCCINDKILIEYDGKGYYHSSKESKIRDKNKEDLAIQLGYKILRISDKSARDIDTIKLIKKYLENE